MLVGRVIQGAGGAVFPLAFGIVRDESPPSGWRGHRRHVGHSRRAEPARDRPGRADPRAPELPLAALVPLIMSATATVATSVFDLSPRCGPRAHRLDRALLMSVGW